MSEVEGLPGAHHPPAHLVEALARGYPPLPGKHYLLSEVAEAVATDLNEYLERAHPTERSKFFEAHEQWLAGWLAGERPLRPCPFCGGAPPEHRPGCPVATG